MVSVHRAVPYFSVVTLVPTTVAQTHGKRATCMHISQTQSLSIHVRDAIRALSSLLLS